MSAKDRAVSICKKIEVALLDCINTEAVVAGMKHLNATLTVIKAMESNSRQNESSFPTLKRPAPNSNTETQIHFKSTKKQCTSLTKSLSKPDRSDVEKCIEEMDEVDVVVCGICVCLMKIELVRDL